MTFTVKPKSFIDDQVPHQAMLKKVYDDTQYVRFVFILEDVPTKPMVSGICPNVDIEPGTQLYKWFSVLNGSELAEGESVDPEDFIGYVAEVKLKKRLKDGIERINVADIIELVAK